MDKKPVREKFLNIRERISINEININNKIIYEKMISNKDFIKANSIFTYVSIGKEVDTISLIENSFKENKKVAVPKVYGKGVMKFYFINSLDDLINSKFNLKEPKNLDIEAIPDNNSLFIVPGIAFDKSKNRIGYGAGYYDRYLSKANYLRTIALAYEKQITYSIPNNQYDVKIDFILTEKTLYY